MRKVIILVISTLLLSSRLSSADVEGTLVRHLKSDPRQKYLVYLPQNYDRKRPCPLFIGIHWAMGTAEGQIEHWHQFTNRDGYVLLCPQFYNGYQWLEHEEDESLVRMMQEVAKEFPYDFKTVYLVGCSGGAQFAHRFAFKHPRLIKAAAIVAAGSYDPPSDDEALKRIKFFVGIGEKDFERLDIAKRFAKDLAARGDDVQFKIFPDLGHSCGIDIQVAVTEFLKAVK